MLEDLLARAVKLRERLVEDGRRADELVRELGEESWLAKVGGCRLDAEAEERYRERARDLLRIIDEEIERLSPLVAAGEEREAS